MADRDTSVVNSGSPVDRRGHREVALGRRPLRSGQCRFVGERSHPPFEMKATPTGAEAETTPSACYSADVFSYGSFGINELLSIPPRYDNGADRSSTFCCKILDCSHDVDEGQECRATAPMVTERFRRSVYREFCKCSSTQMLPAAVQLYNILSSLTYT